MFQIRQAKVWLPIATLLLGISPAALQAAPSLAEMVDSATARNPGMALAGAERNIAQALQRKADQPLAGDPNASIKYQTDAVGSDLGYQEWEAGVELPLWLPGQSGRYAREAERSQDLSDALNQAKRLEIAGEVREHLWEVAIARGEVEQAQSALDVAKELLNDVQRRVAAGELPRSDRLLAEKELLLREETLQQAISRSTLAEHLFAHYTGLDAPLKLVPEQPRVQREPDGDHPRLQLAQRRVDRARSHRDRVSSERRRGPSLWLGAKSVKAVAGGAYDSSIGVGLSMPIGTGAHSAPVLAEAEAALTQAQFERSSALLAVEHDLARTSLEFDRMTATLVQTQRRLELSEDSLKLSRRAFDLGETDLVRLLQAQGDALAARHDFKLRRLQHAQAVARLNQALGVIPQ